MLPGSTDTIVGVATAKGEAGVGIVRLSGPKAIEIANRLFRPRAKEPISKAPNRTMVFGWIGYENQLIDEGFACVMRGPKSFTAEDVVEFHCHGGSFVIETLLKALLQNGARLAEPGEFTQRAFINGRIDLTQAEAVLDIIHAKNALGLEIAVNQLKGTLFEKIESFKQEIIEGLALINAEIEFAEEDLSLPMKQKMTEMVERIQEDIGRMVVASEVGIHLKEGFRVVLAGAPNAGKSSILNGLLSIERAIVTEVPGTTRDTIEESFLIEGISISLTDTAGIRKTDDPVEKIGVERTAKALKMADLILWVLDSVEPDFSEEWLEGIDLRYAKVLMVWNKRDLIKSENTHHPEFVKRFPSIEISAIFNEDIDRLKNKIYETVFDKEHHFTENALITNLRQKQAAQQAHQSLVNAVSLMKSTSWNEELVAMELGESLERLGSIVGATTPDEILNNIFSNFCVGK